MDDVERERETVRLQREAWLNGYAQRAMVTAETRRRVRELYPMPPVERPRVVLLNDRAWNSRLWRFVGGQFQSRAAGSGPDVPASLWDSVAQITPTRETIIALYDLIQRPTEVVTEEQER